MIAEREKIDARELPPLPRLPRTLPQTGREQSDYRVPRSMGERGPRVVRRVRALSWNSPMSAAVLLASFLVCLASLYVSAYAHIAMQSVEKAQLTRDLRAGALREESLHARVSQLTLHSMVQERALQMKMERNSPETAELPAAADALGAGTETGGGGAIASTNRKPIL